MYEPSVTATRDPLKLPERASLRLLPLSFYSKAKHVPIPMKYPKTLPEEKAEWGEGQPSTPSRPQALIPPQLHSPLSYARTNFDKVYHIVLIKYVA
jgi:hypothetical protein